VNGPAREILRTAGLTKCFGGVMAVNDLELVVNQGEIMGLIGPNGAGKSTVFAMISGFLQPTSGQIAFEDRPIAGLSADQIAEAGIARVFQQTLVFRKLSVLENVFVGFHKSYRTPVVNRVLRTRGARAEERRLRAEALEIVEFMGIGALKDELVTNLPHGHQRALNVALALATRPKLLLLDEPVTGMNPSETKRMTELIVRIRDELGVTIMLVEHDMKVVMGICERVVVINFGEKLCEGPPHVVRADPNVCAAYLGTGTFNVA
jgi:branched-chain amino acid transport system ATP-binding protein